MYMQFACVNLELRKGRSIICNICGFMDWILQFPQGDVPEWVRNAMEVAEIDISMCCTSLTSPFEMKKIPRFSSITRSQKINTQEGERNPSYTIFCQILGTLSHGSRENIAVSPCQFLTLTKILQIADHDLDRKI